ncbi:MAG: type I restriction endonuclease [Thermodesulfobacteriota bacterium]|nr:type I restriction endonuclease [Thermodesulfobacteriota bacterium]
MSDNYSENTLVEQPAIKLFAELGWEMANCFNESFGDSPSPLSPLPGGEGKAEIFLGRETKAEVVLVSRLRPVLEKLNPDLPSEAIDLATEELIRDRSRMSMAAANREIYQLIKNGIKVKIPDADGDGDTIEIVRVIDWNEPANNDYFLASQFWITGEMYTRRADLVGFVNGLPLVFMELKATHRRLKTAYTDNLTDYKSAIPQLFWYNALIILSNGSKSEVGSVSAEWEHFADWKKINSEGEEGIISPAEVLRARPWWFA